MSQTRSSITLFIICGLLISTGCELFDDGSSGDDGPVQSTETWIRMEVGRYDMGKEGLASATPVHLVDIDAFYLHRTEVTVRQYGECVNAGACSAPAVESGGHCNWAQQGFENHPVNCVLWQQAVEYCAWAGGRLPSEAEWEYAARSGGDDTAYPWGKASPSCTYAVMANDQGISGCGTLRTWPVCSKPEGNTYDGLCDMAGNAFEWVQDHFHMDYVGDAPLDGSAWEDPLGTFRVIRGNAYNATQDYFLDVASRGNSDPAITDDRIGFRCARSI